ncbi:MAG: SBBP repeat-containing protein [Acidobacteriia bacterium]|nr:SBBP repeat-containing protein [Terriglobia bacterium]
MMVLHRPTARRWCRCVPWAVALLTIGTADAAGAGFAAILGGSGQDYGASVATDSQGNVYVAGLTYSPDFRVTSNALQTKLGGGSDAFVAKFAVS